MPTQADVETIIISNNEKYAIVIMQTEPDEAFRIVQYELENPATAYQTRRSIPVNGDYVKAFQVNQNANGTLFCLPYYDSG